MITDDKVKSKLTEDETVELLVKHLISNSWEIESYCLGQQRGFDIVASRSSKRLYVEVKGAKANDKSPTKKRKFFHSGQIKDHYGKALVKSLETMPSLPNADEPHIVPSHLWKVLICEASADTNVASFLFPQEATQSSSLYDFSVTLKEVEKRSGYSFFSELSPKWKTGFEDFIMDEWIVNSRD
ncbi:MAG: DNA/RNA non-specific endonuclease [Flavobacteriales bacterium]|jgi:hypothetical protein|nr:DNA/RNA non-specific endonuclease [Flavobacteriales bacterium]MBT4929533.1 DNA/RNA non-specific endonuclease [Flavobacteriales bacterium]MBT5131651.1 DNA/RNA non-specific endonuclease [Flavobacteriales bacterium]MBT5716500.1 DNA/RNA non-specific endonuclease [Opitutae bacterium]MBT7749063.1 DNA/RNA non-specific endonuclease [Flavobacteriales bacterium]